VTTGADGEAQTAFTTTSKATVTARAGVQSIALDVTATADDGEIMAVRHRELPVEGVQFHPEAILTEHGKKVLGNFLAATV